jgi:hypothetical protein
VRPRTRSAHGSRGDLSCRRGAAALLFIVEVSELLERESQLDAAAKQLEMRKLFRIYLGDEAPQPVR